MPEISVSDKSTKIKLSPWESFVFGVICMIVLISAQECADEEMHKTEVSCNKECFPNQGDILDKFGEKSCYCATSNGWIKAKTVQKSEKAP